MALPRTVADCIIQTLRAKRFHILLQSLFFRKRDRENYFTAHVRFRLRLKCDGTRADTRFLLSAKRKSPFKWAGASVQSTAGSRGVRISGSNAGYTKFRGSVKGTGYPLHSPVSPSLPLPCVTACHHVSTGLYYINFCTCLGVLYGPLIPHIMPAASQHWLFTFLTNFKISDFNKEHTSSLKMIWMMIETCWGVFKCFNMNILD